jgi:hypothetical protein
LLAFFQIKEAEEMKKLMILIAVMAITGFFTADETLAQRGMKWKDGGGWGPGTSYARMYDPKTVETILGEVISVDRITPQKGMQDGVHLMLKTDKDTISVHLGPGWYVLNQDVKILPKDKIEVRGSRITFEGKPALIAAEIKKGDAVLTLRDTNGFPAWQGWKRR